MITSLNNKLSVPLAGEALLLEVQAGERIVFDFTPETTNMELSQNGNSLQISFDNGGTITLKGFFDFLGTDDAASIELPGEALLSSTDFLNVFAPALAPAAGEVTAGGLNAYSDNAGSLIGSLERLGDQGNIRWNYTNRLEDVSDAGTGTTNAGTPPPLLPTASGVFGIYGTDTSALHGSPYRLFNQGHVDAYFSLQDAAFANSFECVLHDVPLGWKLTQETIDFLKQNNIDFDYDDSSGLGQYTFDFTGTTLSLINISLEAPLSLTMDMEDWKNDLDNGLPSSLYGDIKADAFVILDSGLRASVIIDGIPQSHTSESIEVNSSPRYDSGYDPTIQDDHSTHLILGQPGADDLYSGKGSDILYGGDGHDIFRWDEHNFSANTADRILDFDLDPNGGGSDTLHLSGLPSSSYTITQEFVRWDTSDYAAINPSTATIDGLKVIISDADNNTQEIYLDNVNFDTVKQAAEAHHVQGADSWDQTNTADNDAALDFFFRTYIA